MENGFDAKDLYVVSLGKWIKKTNNGVSLIFKKRTYILAHKLSNKKYEDVFTNSKYSVLAPDTFGNYKIQDKIYCHNPKPINQFFKYQVKGVVIFDTWGYIKEDKAKLLLNDLNANMKDNTENNCIKLSSAKVDNHDEILKNIIKYKDGTIFGRNYDYYNLVKKDFKSSPIIGREKELENLIFTLATNKKNPILVGESGVGKTVIVDMLAYNIKNNNVPNFLLNKNIIEISSDEFLSGTKYRGDLEKKFDDAINIIIKNNDILFIDEIHTIYSGGNEEDAINLAALLKQKMDRNNLKVIGTTTQDEYNKYFANDALKRRFNKINVIEPDEINLRKIIFKIFQNYSLNYNISIDRIIDKIDEISEILIKITDKKNRNILDYTSNPDLVALIIDLSFASARVNNQETLEIKNIIDGLSICDRIYDSIKSKYIDKLSILDKKIIDNNCKIHDFNVLIKKK